jgi:hypothetical protein
LKKLFSHDDLSENKQESKRIHSIAKEIDQSVSNFRHYPNPQNQIRSQSNTGRNNWIDQIHILRMKGAKQIKSGANKDKEKKMMRMKHCKPF